MSDTPPQGLEAFLEQIMRFAQLHDGLPEEDTPLGKLTREFLANNWAECRDGLLERTKRIEVEPEFSPAPHRFRFTIHCRYKRRNDDGTIEVADGPVRGQIVYRGDLFENPQPPTVAVMIDRDLKFCHPNFCQKRGVICLGDHSSIQGPFALDQLLATQIYPIVTYQNRRPSHPLDLGAARYFALEPDAMAGLEHVEPLY